MVAPQFPTWRETLPIATQPVPGPVIQPVVPAAGSAAYMDPATIQYPDQATATAARTALTNAGVTVGYYGVFKRWDGRFQLWPDGKQPLPGVKVA